MSAAGELLCGNCGVGHGADDIFCENCGYDFITGSLPSSEEELASLGAGLVPDPAVSVATQAGDGGEGKGGGPDPDGVGPVMVGSSGRDAQPERPARLRVSVSVDRAYFDAAVSEGELDFPEQPFPSIEVDVAGDEIHIGRTSQSRAIHPDLDIAQLSGDPAVSSRHAVLRVAEDGTVTVTDLDSTNGTFVGEVDSKAVAVGEAVTVLAPGSEAGPVFVGAWTRLDISAIEY